MPSIVGHVLLGGASGWALPRRLLPASAVLAGAVCSALPDVDGVGFALGVPYGHWLGHRGFSHSLVFALLLAGALSALASAPPRFTGSPRVLFVYLAACTASHGLLDSMTSGGLGVAFLSPFSDQRFFLPWRPIVVSPLNPLRLLSAWGLRVLFSETVCIGLPVVVICLARSATGRLRGARALREGSR